MNGLKGSKSVGRLPSHFQSGHFGRREYRSTHLTDKFILAIWRSEWPSFRSSRTRSKRLVRCSCFASRARCRGDDGVAEEDDSFAAGVGDVTESDTGVVLAGASASVIGSFASGE